MKNAPGPVSIRRLGQRKSPGGGPRPTEELWPTCARPQNRRPVPPGLDYALWIRLLFSCLVDADFLDTEVFMNPDQAASRGGYPTLEEMRPLLQAHLERLTAKAPASEVKPYPQGGPGPMPGPGRRPTRDFFP